MDLQLVYMFHHIKSKQKTRFSKGHTNLDLDLDKKQHVHLSIL